MNAESFREYSARLNLLYAGCFASLRAAFFPIAPRAIRARAVQDEPRRECKGGKPK